MEYSKNDNEFYDLILDKTKEIKEMNIPEEKKKDLYNLVDEIIQRYKEQKNLHLEENFRHLAEAWDGLYKSLEKLGMLAEEMKKNLPTLERVVSELRDKKQEREKIDKNNMLN